MNIEIIKFDRLESTNSYVREHALELADGVLVVGAEQTGGRGRMGRVWVSPPGANIYATLVMKCLYEPFHSGCVLGLAALRTVREFAPDAVSFLKWPNDVYCEDRKIAGLLCETCIHQSSVAAIAAGIGLNVNMTPEILKSIGTPATGLNMEAGVAELDLEQVVKSFAGHLGAMYELYRDCPDVVLSLWQVENRLIGEEVTVIAADGAPHTGTFTGIALDGELIMKRPDGGEERFFCGDVTLDRDRIDWSAVAARCRKKKN